MSYELAQIAIGQSKLEYSARMYEGMAQEFDASDFLRATACREMAKINRDWKQDNKICLRFAANNKIPMVQ